MSTVFQVDGGLGRVVSALPALLKYHKNHPDKEWYVVIPAWDFVVFSIPELQRRTHYMDDPKLFDSIIRNAKEYINPEPYKIPEYYRQEISLAEAFDKVINKTDDHSDLEYDTLRLSKFEMRMAQIILNENTDGKKKRIVINPFGSSAQQSPFGVVDNSNRSLTEEVYLKLVKKLSSKYDVIYFGDLKLAPKGDTYTYKIDPDPNLRVWMALINACDYFIGCDTSGQHIARSLNKPGTVILGGTHENNVSYPDHFEIFKRDCEFHYSPMRISAEESALAERLMDCCMDFTDEEIDIMVRSIDTDIEKHVGT